MVAVVVAVLHPIELISFNFDFDELFHPSPVGHWFARFRFCHSYWWFWLWFWFRFLFLFSFSSIYLCWMFFFCFTSVCFVLSTNSVLLPLSIALSVRSVVWLPLSSLFSIYPHCVCTMVYRRIWTTTKTLLIEFRCVTIFEIIFQQIFDECVLYC